MKVLQFITRLDLGGAQECCLDFCRELARRGHEPHLLTGSGGELMDDARRIDGLRLHVWDDWRHAVRPLADLRCLLRLRRLLREGSFDLLHTHSSKAGLIGRLAAATAGGGVRVVHHVHGWSFNTTMPAWKRGIYAALERLASRPGFVLLACSRETAEQGRRHRIGRREDRRVIYCGIDRAENLRRRDRAAIRRRLGLAERDVLFLQVGNLKFQKDPLTFARAAVRVGAESHRARFWIAGDGPLREESERIAREGGLGDRFRVLGWRRDVSDLLCAADVKVLTSRFEGLPFAVIRAMTAGLPVVATAVDGTPEAVEEGVNGFLVPPGEVEPIAAAMSRLGRSPRLRRRMGAAGRRRSRMFNDRDNIGEVLRLYEELIEGGEREQPPASVRGGCLAAG